ncbi:unnamed protein product [Arctia plantaginis]|uniref:Uncharacterized protein n=1 Tax=Arctia plantaginis TaxID=874455 RepID=A0A8S1AIJ5_ARCPL|nr:unnamed protein product [Arctia plantaginis]
MAIAGSTVTLQRRKRRELLCSVSRSLWTLVQRYTSSKTLEYSGMRKQPRTPRNVKRVVKCALIFYIYIHICTLQKLRARNRFIRIIEWINLKEETTDITGTVNC